MAETRSVWVLLALAALCACGEAAPTMVGRLNQPAGVVAFRGCPQQLQQCDLATQGHTLLLISVSADDALRVFDADRRQFFSAPDPLFPLAIPVGDSPRRLALEPTGTFAFVVNAGSQDVSVVDTRRLIEVDTDWDSCSSFCGSCRDWQPPQYLDDRCRAGVSRVSLGTGVGLFPEGLALGPVQESADGEKTMDVYVSLLGTGKIARMRFTYPRPEPAREQRLEWVGEFTPGGQPAGLAVTPDGRWLYAADEAAESIAAIDTVSGDVERIDVGGISSEARISPDGGTIFVLLPQRESVVFIDAAARIRRSLGAVRPDARGPDNGPEEIFLGSMPRSLEFVRGVATSVFNDLGSAARDYTRELLSTQELAEIQAENPDFSESPVKTLALVSTLEGKVVVIDAENQRPIDIWPFQGPSISSQPTLTVAGEEIAAADLDACADDPDCHYPTINGYRDAYNPPVDAEGYLLSCSGKGQAVLDGSGRPACQCEAGYFADQMSCISEEQGEPLYPGYGVFLRPGYTRSESWLLTWEGAILGTEPGSRGVFSGWRLHDRRPGLDLRVLGVQEGDILQVITEPDEPTDLPDNPCRRGSGAGEAESRQVDFTIDAVGADYLEIRPIEGMDPGNCWPAEVNWRARAASAWTVWGTLSGPAERLRMESRGSVVGARPAYDNGRWGITMFAPAIDPGTGKSYAIARDSTWNFTVASGFNQANFSPTAQVGGAGALVAVDLDVAEERVDDRVYWLFEFSNAMMEFFPANLSSTNYLIYQ